MIPIIVFSALVLSFGLWRWHDSVISKAVKKAVEYERKSVGNELMSAHYWFSGRNPHTFNVLFMFAKRLQNGYGLHVDEVRRKADELADKRYTEAMTDEIKML